MDDDDGDDGDDGDHDDDDESLDDVCFLVVLTAACC